MQTKMRINTVTCPQCQIEIYSRTRHDYRSCYCGRTFVDGGFDYMRYGLLAGKLPPLVRTRYIKATRQELYDDWTLGSNNFGIFSKGAR